MMILEQESIGLIVMSETYRDSLEQKLQTNNSLYKSRFTAIRNTMVWYSDFLAPKEEVTDRQIGWEGGPFSVGVRCPPISRSRLDNLHPKFPQRSVSGLTWWKRRAKFNFVCNARY